MNQTQTHESPDLILGEEFLTWLWYKCDVAPDCFMDKSGNDFHVSVEKRIVVQGGNGETKEIASVSGSLSPLREARFGLATGKKVSRAFLRIEKDDLCWQFSISANNFSFQSLRSPKLDRKEEDNDPDALILEKIFLIESCLQLFDCIYEQFLNLRFSSYWEVEVEAVRTWMTEMD